jgi:hypothetical protein
VSISVHCFAFKSISLEIKRLTVSRKPSANGLLLSGSLTKMAKKDYYQILGVKKDAKADEIKNRIANLREISHGRTSE